ncbi:MAG: CBS domain-containing protein, partial [Saprospiraceae bacterium]|nr:CBS domain-containing protein [Saprospiraceae bacterium]
LAWKNIHHLPVENFEGDLVGLITDGMINRLDANDPTNQIAKDIMLTELQTIRAQDSLAKAKSKMVEHNLAGMPVVFGKKLVGVLTKNDFEKMQHSSASVNTN